MNSLSANARYTIGILVTMSLYAAILAASLWAIRTQHPTGLWLDLLAIAPALPVGGAIVVFHRYIAEVDEYVRAVVVKRFVTATGATLFICTAIGFLENGTGKTLMPLYLVYPTFWVCFAAACAIHRKAT
jgi:hypothetical protein